MNAAAGAGDGPADAGGTPASASRRRAVRAGGASAVVGYWLGRAHWGRGVMTEALAMLTGWAWAALPGTARLWLPICARNGASQAVARKAGYRFEGRLELAALEDGRAIDVVQFGLTRPEATRVEWPLPTLAPCATN